MKTDAGDNLFDTKITPLDVVKILLLIVTMFSTWNIVDLMTPDSRWAWVREVAAVGVIEGAFLGFEYATKDAKTRGQMRYATVGFFMSLTVISIFLGASGLLEFAGPAVLTQAAGQFLGIDFTVRDWVMTTALLITVSWIFVLASIYRLYALADPDKRAELEKNQINGKMKTDSNKAFAAAMASATPVITIQRALAQIRKDHQEELTPEQLRTVLAEAERHLRGNMHDLLNEPTAPSLFDRMAGLFTPAAPVVYNSESEVRPEAESSGADYGPVTVDAPSPTPPRIPGYLRFMFNDMRSDSNMPHAVNDTGCLVVIDYESANALIAQARNMLPALKSAYTAWNIDFISAENFDVSKYKIGSLDEAVSALRKLQAESGDSKGWLEIKSSPAPSKSNNGHNPKESDFTN